MSPEGMTFSKIYTATGAQGFVQSCHLIPHLHKPREVRVIGVCGPSASGKSTLTRTLDGRLDTAVSVIEADWFFRRADAPACTLPEYRYRAPWDRRCLNQPESVDNERLQQEIMRIVGLLRDPACMLVPPVTVSTNAGPRPLNRRAGEPLGPGPVYFQVEGIVLFSQLRLCELLHAGLWLNLDERTALVRRWVRENPGREWNDADPACIARAQRYKHTYAHTLAHRDMQLRNISDKLVAEIDANPEAKQVADDGAARLLARLG